MSKFKVSDKESAEDTVSVTDKEISIIKGKPAAFAQNEKQDALKTRPIERSLKEVTKK